MSGFTPIFEKLVDSSIWLEPYAVRVVWITMLAKQDKDHVVRGDSFLISVWAKMPEAEVIDALKILSSPDTRRLNPGENEGRRIKEVSGGYLLLNGDKYQHMMSEIFRRAKQAECMRKKRERMKVKSGGTLAERNAVAEANQEVGAA